MDDTSRSMSSKIVQTFHSTTARPRFPAGMVSLDQWSRRRRIPLVIDHHPGLPDISDILRKYVLLHGSKKLRLALPEVPIVAFFKHQICDLCNALVRAKSYQAHSTGGRTMLEIASSNLLLRYFNKIDTSNSLLVIRWASSIWLQVILRITVCRFNIECILYDVQWPQK